MLFIQLLVIQLIPDFLMIATAVVAAHWIWLFRFNKRGNAPTVRLTGSHTHIQSLEDGADCIPASSPTERIQPSTEQPSQHRPAPPQGLEAQRATDQRTIPIPQNELAEKYAGVSILPLLTALQQNEVEQEVIHELDALARLTGETAKANAWSACLAEHRPSLAFIA